MSAEHPSEPYISSKQETKFVPATFESRSVLENMSAKDLSIQKQQREAKIQQFQKLDKNQVIAKGGNIDTQSSESDVKIQAENELAIVNKAIEGKIKTLQEAATDMNVSYAPEDVLELYAIFMPDSKANNQQALLGIRDRIASLIEAIPKADGKNMPILSADELMSISGLKIPKNDPKYTTYKKIIAISLIDGLRDKTQFTGENIGDRELEKEAKRLSSEKQVILENILATRKSSSNDQTDILRSMTTTDDILKIIGTSGNYERAKNILEGDAYGLTLSQEQYTSLATNAKEVIKNADENTKRAQENQGAQVAALKKGNLVEALQQETKYQRETSQIEYYRDLRSSLSKTEGNQINSTIPTSKNNINVGGSDFSTKLTYFMNDEQTNSIYPKLSDGTTIPIIKAGDDVYIVQGCQVPADEVEGLVKLNQTLAEKGLRFFSTKSPLTKILTNIEQTLRTKGVQNVPYFGDLKNVSTYQDNIVDILYSIIDPDPKTPSPNVNERIDLTSKRLKNGIPLIAYGRQSGIVKEDSSIDLNKITEKLTTVIQSGYPFRFGGEK